MNQRKMKYTCLGCGIKQTEIIKLNESLSELRFEAGSQDETGAGSQDETGAGNNSISTTKSVFIDFSHDD